MSVSDDDDSSPLSQAVVIRTTLLSFSSAKDILWSRDLFADSLIASGHTRDDGVTKLYISNLDYGESSEDIKVYWFLIINADFDMNGRPSFECLFSEDFCAGITKSLAVEASCS
ncbi:hypothetical protein KSP40_PGU013625 [Platanthera guangdongensis]|uniref:Uncharacterized protein n=1 Tax=Platanthera guangdongensis TaxID=2320717 RepID=A0ABR2LRV3_9ASPA